MLTWRQSKNGNPICFDDEGLACTVHQKPLGWGVVVNTQGPPHFAGPFDTEAEAKAYAEDVIPNRHRMRPTSPRRSPAPPSDTDWESDSIQNGELTYRRRARGILLRVRCASNGQWYWVAEGKTDGWSDDAEGAMAKADQRFNL